MTQLHTSSQKLLFAFQANAVGYLTELLFWRYQHSKESTKFLSRNCFSGEKNKKFSFPGNVSISNSWNKTSNHFIIITKDIITKPIWKIILFKKRIRHWEFPGNSSAQVPQNHVGGIKIYAHHAITGSYNSSIIFRNFFPRITKLQCYITVTQITKSKCSIIDGLKWRSRE